MRAAHSGISISQALRRVFLPLLEPHLSYPPRSLFVSARHFYQRRSLYINQNQRTYGPKDGPNAPLRDEAIKSEDICLVGEDNKLQEPQWIEHVLGRMDRKNYFLVQVSHPDDPGVPVCKILEKKKVYAEAKAKEKSKKRKSPEQSKKGLEINWAIDAHDLSHRLKRLKQFLSEGRKVEVLLADKRKGKKTATAEEMEAVIRKIESAAREVPGAKCVNIETAAKGKVATMFLEGAMPNSSQVSGSRSEPEKEESKTEPDKDKVIEKMGIPPTVGRAMAEGVT